MWCAHVNMSVSTGLCTSNVVSRALRTFAPARFVQPSKGNVRTSTLAVYFFTISTLSLEYDRFLHTAAPAPFLVCQLTTSSQLHYTIIKTALNGSSQLLYRILRVRAYRQRLEQQLQDPEQQPRQRARLQGCRRRAVQKERQRQQELQGLYGAYMQEGDSTFVPEPWS
ncbi:hypothetical protein B0T26DRAFT_806943 [Lasiosphaeria miniovina]|uniref:Uncharacterized protein n=1 Tax=Lasiosphaeria miniovina TaxID=1954250 RepID=A0AA39ZTD1_9PEZI|nr:uncharacterized protein B0T26DRAFT_806943 [Lasiosphaeria miniovina]KAK0703351.1 hypothetical protein B0T26DRAFT_806943 [Lasiosphaeria miniovina]